VPRPTPQRENLDPETFPRFKDRLPEDFGGRTDINPFLQKHAEFGPPLLTADQAWRYRGRWDECFGRQAPLHVEIGPGNGFFLTEVSRRNPDVNVLGLEIRYKRTVLCATKLVRAGIENARIARYHAGFLDDLFLEGSVDALYINHPDPWPKERHEKNRLISRWFLEDAARLLAPGAPLRLKSDYRDNVYRVPDLLDHDGEGEPAERLPFTITGISDDVITGPAPWPDDIETNYQSKYRKKGEPVYAIEIVRT
jgi:tRNA (guanine-N7-)-methyltransferase